MYVRMMPGDGIGPTSYRCENLFQLLSFHESDWRRLPAQNRAGRFWAPKCNTTFPEGVFFS